MRRKVAAAMLAAFCSLTILGTSMPVFAEEEVVDGAEEEDYEEGTAEIKVALMTTSAIDSDACAHVQDAMNELLLDKINVQAEFMWFDPTTYATQVPMMLQAGEHLDLIMFTPVPGSGYQSFMSQNQLMDITDYIEEYGENITEVMGDYLQATTKNGRLYGVGGLTSLAGYEAVTMRKDILDELGLTEKAQNMTTWTEYEEIMQEVVANTDLNGVVNSDQEGSCISPQPYLNAGDAFEDTIFVDTLGDSFQYTYADSDTDTVNCYFYSDGWYESVKRAKQYYDEGLIFKDAANSQDYAESLVKNGVGFSMVKQCEDGSVSTLQSATGYEIMIVPVKNRMVTTDSILKFGFCVPITASEPEAAVKLMNLLYGDTEVQDTLTWGVEGVDYVQKDDGTLTYPDGVTADTVLYHTADFLYGNRLNVTPWEGDGVDVRERQAAGNASVTPSKYLGFSVDSTVVSTEISACKNVVDKYKPQLSSGSVDDVDAVYQAFVSELSAAGMDKILETYQAQLDEWLASK